jgi:hypothetical protein
MTPGSPQGPYAQDQFALDNCFVRQPPFVAERTLSYTTSFRFLTVMSSNVLDRYDVVKYILNRRM